MREKLWNTRPVSQRSGWCWQQRPTRNSPAMRCPSSGPRSQIHHGADDHPDHGRRADRRHRHQQIQGRQPASLNSSPAPGISATSTSSPPEPRIPMIISRRTERLILETLPYWEGKAMEDIADRCHAGTDQGVHARRHHHRRPHQRRVRRDHLRPREDPRPGPAGLYGRMPRNIDAMLPKCHGGAGEGRLLEGLYHPVRGLITYAHRMAEEAERQAADVHRSKSGRRNF